MSTFYKFDIKLSLLKDCVYKTVCMCLFPLFNTVFILKAIPLWKLDLDWRRFPKKEGHKRTQQKWSLENLVLWWQELSHRKMSFFFFLLQRNFKGLVIHFKARFITIGSFRAHSMEMANPSGLEGDWKGRRLPADVELPAVRTCPISQPDHSLGRKMAEIKEKFTKQRFGLFSHLLVEIPGSLKNPSQAPALIQTGTSWHRCSGYVRKL